MVYVFLADGFEECEALIPVDILRRGGIDVKTVGVTGRTVTGAHGIPVVCDITADGAGTEGLCAVVLPGGMPGTLNLKNSARVKEFLEYANGRGLLTAAICAAPSVLGGLGLLRGKRATCFPGFENELIGAEVLKEPVVRDGNIITSRGAGTAFQFGFCLLAALTGNEEAAERLAEDMIYGKLK